MNWLSYSRHSFQYHIVLVLLLSGYFYVTISFLTISIFILYTYAFSYNMHSLIIWEPFYSYLSSYYTGFSYFILILTFSLLYTLRSIPFQFHNITKYIPPLPKVQHISFYISRSLPYIIQLLNIFLVYYIKFVCSFKATQAHETDTASQHCFRVLRYLLRQCIVERFEASRSLGVTREWAKVVNH